MPMQESKPRIDGNDSLTAAVVVFSNVTTNLPTFSYALGSTDAEHERLIRQAARFLVSCRQTRSRTVSAALLAFVSSLCDFFSGFDRIFGQVGQKRVVGNLRGTALDDYAVTSQVGTGPRSD